MPGSSSSSSSKIDIARQVNRGLAWVGLASSMVGLLDIIAYGVIWAFWLSNEEIGVAAVAISLFPALDLLADVGLSSAVIQRDDHSEDKISTVFWLNLTLSGILFALLALVFGPALARLQNAPIVASLLAVYGVKLVWQNVYFIPHAMMRRELRFKEISIIRVLANLAEFAAKIGVAAAGYGIWCFVMGPLARVLITGVGTQICNPWRPRLVLRLRLALDWAAFGFKASASQILYHLYTNVDYQVVAYFIGKEAAGLYTIAYMVVLEPCKVVGNVITNIAFPAFSRLKDRPKELIAQFITFTRMNLVVMLLFLGVVFVAADDLLLAFWGADRLPAAPLMRILCAVGVLRALSLVPPPLLDGLGRPGLTLTYMMVAAIVLPSGFVVSATLFGQEHGAVAVAVAWAVGYPIAFAVLAVLALRQLHLSATAYLRRIAGIPLCAAAAGSLAAAVHWIAAGLPALASLAASSATMIASFLLLLAYTQGISPRSVAMAVKGQPSKEMRPGTVPAPE